MLTFPTPIDIERAFGVDFHGKDNCNVLCPFHDDTRESCSVSINGIFNCKSCGKAGTAVDFYAKSQSISVDDATKQLSQATPDVPHKKRKRKRRFNTSTATPLSDDIVSKTQAHLATQVHSLRYLHDRGLTNETLHRYRIGADEYRITLPIYESDKLVNIRRYLPNSKSAPKMVSHQKGDGSARLYPHDWPMRAIEPTEPLTPDDILVLCEGEWDCLLLRQNGFNAVTTTGGVTTWSSSWTLQLSAYSVVIIYDVHDKDDVGQRMANARAKEFVALNTKTKVVVLPLPESYVGGDITDYFVRTKNTADDLHRLIDDTDYYMHTKAATQDVDDDLDDLPLSTLSCAAHAQYYYEPIRVRCLVAGKGISPYIIPKTIRAEVQSDSGSHTIERTLDAWNGSILDLLDCTTAKQKATLHSIFNIRKDTKVKFTIVDAMNVEELYLIPALGDNTIEDDEYTMRKCFFVGKGIKANHVYDFTGYTLPDPKSQAATHIFISATSSTTDIDNVVLSSEHVRQLRALFHTNNVWDKLADIATQLSNHVTKIYGRADLHIGIDLVFHSPISFDFDNVRVRKGWLEALIIGDTRTGKGFVAEGLTRHYRVGEVVSGENCTLAGLVGGIQRIGDRWMLVWGRIPLSDRRMIIIDEAGSLTYNEISRLSRIRSEGIAEVTKIISQKTNSRTRLLWLANPRPSHDGTPRMIDDYNYGVESISDLIGSSEDIARFDFAMVLGQNEVGSEVINRKHTVQGTLRYVSDMCCQLIRWIWSRKPEQIKFADGVTEYALRAAHDLGRRFIPKPCLIQSEDIRFKLARIACAVAGRTFSSPDGVMLLVTKEHLEFAYNFLCHIYSTQACGYATLSTVERERASIRDTKAVKDALEQAGDFVDDLIAGLLEHRVIQARDLADYGGIDIYRARELISSLVRERALVKEASVGYVKKLAFKRFLQMMRASRIPEETITEGVSNAV